MLRRLCLTKSETPRASKPARFLSIHVKAHANVIFRSYPVAWLVATKNCKAFGTGYSQAAHVPSDGHGINQDAMAEIVADGLWPKGLGRMPA